MEQFNSITNDVYNSDNTNYVLWMKNKKFELLKENNILKDITLKKFSVILKSQ